tara:strand:- start:626 stop:1123 length:498 start_codon:yes stop_codon:yes gene_type:complete
MKKETGALIFGMILGGIGILGLQMFKEGNTDTLSRLKKNNRVVKRIPTKTSTETSIAALSRPSTTRPPMKVSESVNGVATGGTMPSTEFKDHWMYNPSKKGEKIWVTSKAEHESLDAKGWVHEEPMENEMTDSVQVTDENNNPVAQNPVVQPQISFTRSTMGGRY